MVARPFLLAGIHMAWRVGNTGVFVPRSHLTTPCRGRSAGGSSAPQNLLEQRDAARVSALGQPEHRLLSQPGITMRAGHLQEGGDPLVILQLREREDRRVPGVVPV